MKIDFAVIHSVSFNHQHDFCLRTLNTRNDGFTLTNFFYFFEFHQTMNAEFFKNYVLESFRGVFIRNQRCLLTAQWKEKGTGRNAWHKNNFT
ncbi:hypothetical protein DYD21_03775 [Rhodohalobacter sp. SW132]|nr:hypothetical protein DYD21_03775 [Rhodohalobacter sp. SW132]